LRSAEALLRRIWSAQVYLRSAEACCPRSAGLPARGRQDLPSPLAPLPLWERGSRGEGFPAGAARRQPRLCMGYKGPNGPFARQEPRAPSVASLREGPRASAREERGPPGPRAPKAPIPCLCVGYKGPDSPFARHHPRAPFTLPQVPNLREGSSDRGPSGPRAPKAPIPVYWEI